MLRLLPSVLMVIAVLMGQENVAMAKTFGSTQTRTFAYNQISSMQLTCPSKFTRLCLRSYTVGRPAGNISLIEDNQALRDVVAAKVCRFRQMASSAVANMVATCVNSTTSKPTDGKSAADGKTVADPMAAGCTISLSKDDIVPGNTERSACVRSSTSTKEAPTTSTSKNAVTIDDFNFFFVEYDCIDNSQTCASADSVEGLYYVLIYIGAGIGVAFVLSAFAACFVLGSKKEEGKQS